MRRCASVAGARRQDMWVDHHFAVLGDDPGWSVRKPLTKIVFVAVPRHRIRVEPSDAVLAERTARCARCGARTGRTLVQSVRSMLSWSLQGVSPATVLDCQIIDGTALSVPARRNAGTVAELVSRVSRQHYNCTWPSRRSGRGRRRARSRPHRVSRAGLDLHESGGARRVGATSAVVCRVAFPSVQASRCSPADDWVVVGP